VHTKGRVRVRSTRSVGRREDLDQGEWGPGGRVDRGARGADLLRARSKSAPRAPVLP
jgi:hypothetical protein